MVAHKKVRSAVWVLFIVRAIQTKQSIPTSLPETHHRKPQAPAPSQKAGVSSLKWRKKSFFVQKHCHPILPKTKRDIILWDLSPCNSHPFRSSGALSFVVCRSRADCSMHFLPTGARTFYAKRQVRCAHFFLVVFLRPRSSLTFKLFALYLY